MISDVANACNLSETHFRRLFAQHMHISPYAFINLVRIEAACKLMRNSQDSLQIIAEKCGYCSAQSFDRNFKKAFGITPSQWRKEVDNDPNKIASRHIRVFTGWT